MREEPQAHPRSSVHGLSGPSAKRRASLPKQRGRGRRLARQFNSPVPYPPSGVPPHWRLLVDEEARKRYGLKPFIMGASPTQRQENSKMTKAIVITAIVWAVIIISAGCVGAMLFGLTAMYFGGPNAGR